MKKFTRIIDRKGKQYAYEITPYYDPETKNTKQKSRYLGVYEDGKIIRKRSKIPKCVFDYGDLVPFLNIIGDMKLDVILKSELSDKHADTILTLALNRVVKPVSACNIQMWYEGTYLSKLYGDLPLSSQSLSDFMEVLGESPIPRDFSQALIDNVGKGDPLLYDITSLSSASKLMDILEYGYNRDGDALPQLNLSIIAHKDLGIPLCFDVRPGSVVDVSTLTNTTKTLQAYGLSKPTVVMDRGFFSETNLNDLIDKEFNFIIPASFASKDVKSLVSKVQENIERPDNLNMFKGKTIFVKPIVFNVEKGPVDGFVYYDMKREKEEKNKFYARLHDIKERLMSRKLKSWEKPSKVFENITGKFSKYFSWRVVGRQFKVTVKNKAVSQRVNRMGFTVILYRGVYSWEEVLTWTRERDIIEKMFLTLKRDIEVKPMRAHKTEVAKGWIFVTFVALIMRCRLSKMMVETGLVKKYSIPSLLLALGRIKQVELSDGSIMMTEVPKKQRLIFEALDMQP